MNVAAKTIVSNLVLAFFITIAAGCQSYQPDRTLVSQVERGELGHARARLLATASADPGDRNFLIDRMKLAMVSLADGAVEACEPEMDSLYDFLRTQGLNANKTIPSVVFYEDRVRIWKGEPFEQALAFYYIGVLDAINHDWGNARASAENSLFYIRDFGLNEKGETPSREDVIRGDYNKNAEAAPAASEAANNTSEEPFEDYKPVESNFALGYLLAGFAAQQIGELQESREHYQKAVRIDPNLSSVAGAFESKSFNTLFVVDGGFCPTKVATGPDNAIAAFAINTPSTNAPLRVSIQNQTLQFPVACDVNKMAADLRWNNLEDLRQAKSLIGNVLIAGGVAYAAIGQKTEDVLIGAGIAAIGLFVKSTAHADTRHCELLPQAIYLAPVSLAQDRQTVSLQIGDSSATRVVLPDVRPGTANKPEVYYVRLLNLNSSAPSWVNSGTVYYSNDFSAGTGKQNYPYILGGDCVRTPTAEVLQSYQNAGYLRDLSLSELRQLYQEENIRIVSDEKLTTFGTHILEGGDALYTPRPGSIGFIRLFGEVRPPYSPRSERARMIANQLQPGAAVPAPAPIQ
ncbi:MAG: tetratricopeptide repeat protein [Planctomycetota bacterium]